MSKKKQSNDIPVYCAHTAMVDISQVYPNPKNPNTHSQQQIELLAKIIKTQGWHNPIVISDRNGLITKGHCRLASAQLLGLSEVPVDVQHYDSEQSELADMLADNRIAEMAEMDSNILKDILQEIDTGAYDMDLTGYDEQSIEELMTQYHLDDIDDEGVEESDMSSGKMLTCPHCGCRFTKGGEVVDDGNK